MAPPRRARPDGAAPRRTPAAGEPGRGARRSTGARGGSAGRSGGSVAGEGGRRRPPEAIPSGALSGGRRTGPRPASSPPWSPPGPKGWGSLARKGARGLKTPDDRPRDQEYDDRGRPPAWEPERWEREDAPAPADRRAGEPTPVAPDRPRRRAPKAVADEVVRAVGAASAAKVEGRLVDAAAAFERDRPQDTLRLLRPLLRDASGVPSVRELAGLALYRQGRWAEAARHLEAFRAATGSVEQHPVLADCYRALGRYAKVDELWAELREASPEPELMVEGRIVAAGALADRGDIQGAIRLLERGPLEPRRAVRPYHLRLWYALADLHERAGDTPRARSLFTRVVEADAGLADAAERLHALG